MKVITLLLTHCQFHPKWKWGFKIIQNAAPVSCFHHQRSKWPVLIILVWKLDGEVQKQIPGVRADMERRQTR